MQRVRRGSAAAFSVQAGRFQEFVNPQGFRIVVRRHVVERPVRPHAPIAAGGADPWLVLYVVAPNAAEKSPKTDINRKTDIFFMVTPP